MLHGDFGTSTLTAPAGARTTSPRFFPATLELATLATLLGVLLGMPAGRAGRRPCGRWPDQVVRVVGLVGYSVPVFWLGLMGLLLFYGKLGWVGGPGRLDVFYRGHRRHRVTGLILVDAALAGDWDVFCERALPPRPAGLDARLLLAGLYRPHDAQLHAEQLRQEYVTTARVKGMPERRVIWRACAAQRRWCR